MDCNVTTQPAASSSSPSTHQWKYDVFLNFRGADTRVSVVDPLYSRLLNRGIDTFWDDDLLKKEGDIPREIFEAIEKSSISVVIFSENYASSTWCLDELAKIIECKNSQQQIVLPIFYDVASSDVRDQTGTFGEAFVEHEDRFKDDLEKVSRWRSALEEVANLAGMFLNKDRSESKFIHEITEEISRLLKRAYLTYETDYLVGIDPRIREMNDLLGVGAADVRMVGMWGIGGMGKTTLAKVVYNSVAHKFEGSCFLGNVRENSEAPGGLVQLQKTLLHSILGLKISSLTNADSGVDIIRRRLCDKRVLLIIDDVDDLNQLKCLAGSSNWFGAGSRIIITTKYEHLFRSHKVDFRYQVKELEPDEAKDLFHSKAFPTSKIPNDYLEPASRVVDYAQGNPLALIEVGSFLCGKSIFHWNSILERCERAPASNIQEILKIIKKEAESELVELESLEMVGAKQKFDVDLEEGLNEVGSLEMPKADDLDEVKAAETNKGSAGGDENRPNSEQPRLIFFGVDVTGISDWIFLIISLILEIISAICDQFSSSENPKFAVIGVVLAVLALVICVSELIYKGDFGCSGCSGSGHLRLGMFFCPKTYRLFGTLPDLFGLICGISQCASSIVQCVCVLRRKDNPFKGILDWIFLIISLILEIISAICDQLSSSEKPEFAVIGMVLAILALVICVSELFYKGKGFEFGRCRMCLWWFFSPETGRLFGTLPDLFGLICGIAQGASSVVQYMCVLRSKDNPFKVNLLPIIFLICVGGSKLFGDCKRCTEYSGSRSMGRNNPAESQDSGRRTMSLDRTPDSGSVEGGRVSGPQLSFPRKRVGNSNEKSGDGAVGSIEEGNCFVAAEINGYPRSSQTTSTNLTC